MSAQPVPTPLSLPVADDAWRAVATRDASADGRFVYAVVTTGVFCKPSCPSRRPLRENARFFPSSGDAARAGYRACLRCRPAQGQPGDDPRVTATLALVDRHLALGDPARLTLAILAERLDLSPFHLHRVLRAALGVPFAQYLRARRRERLKQALRRGRSVSQATFDAGFGSSSRVYDSVASTLGMTPGAYRRGGAGVNISFDLFDTPLGTMIIAGTAHGVCHVAFGDEPGALERALRAEFSRASLSRDRSMVRAWAVDIIAQLEGKARQVELPLDVAGTPFQQQVWTELRRIPFGEMRSYQELAVTIGRPSAARAVARACASNRVAVVIPCHRVVRGTGALGGYRWGLERKRKLLDRERELSG
ncbi:MAG: bifunctional DNA-binding transcriptional regulator/O6-methylguanine-DNA methyltransferase Ada [Gemmatimonadaceae bacterium]